MDEKLTALLKEMLISINNEGRLVPPNLENEMCLALDKLGGEWLLAGLEAQGIEGASEIRQKPDLYWEILKGEPGQKKLKAVVAEKATAIIEMRRKVVGLLRLFKKGNQGIEFKIDMLPDDGGIYKILCDLQKGD